MHSELNLTSISIIIPTLNRDRQLGQLLEMLSQENVEGVEVIIVDDSKVNSKIDFDQYQLPVNYIFRATKLGVSSARNVGADAANGKYLIFFDDDDGFTLGWLADFAGKLEDSPDLVFCDMLRTEPNGAQSTITCTNYGDGGRGNGIVIPGAWMIKKSVFTEVGGFDERLLYAENTEFFIRVDKLKLNREFIPKVNFLYNPSPTGGSKNLQNMIDSLLIILDKHRDTLSSHVKHLYHQIIGVNLMRFQSYSAARYHLWKAFQYKPFKVSTLGRLGVACFPFLARCFYTESVKHD